MDICDYYDCKPLLCVDRNGRENTFMYWKTTTYDDNNKEIWNFKIKPKDVEVTDFFQFSITLIDDSSAKITVCNRHNNNVYKAMGIPEKLIEEAQGLTGKTIVSSSNNPKFKTTEAEYRTPDADKYWERLVLKGMATYHSTRDQYTYTGNCQSHK